MKKLFAIAFAILWVCGCFGCVAAPATETTTVAESDTMLSKDRTYNVLFIGNSYTFYNDMPTAYFEPMVKLCGYDVRVTTITKGAYTLEKFADPSDPYGQMVNTALSAEGSFGFVILQEQSARPAIDPEAFYAAVRNLNERIRAIGAKPVLYATWGRQTGSDTLTKYDMTNESMTYRLAAAYSAIGQELDIPVLHAGLAFYWVNSGDNHIDLYNADKSHPSVAGSYLAAMTLVCGIWGIDPVTAPLSGPLTPEEDAIVRQAVAEALGSPQIPEEYVVSSSQGS
jgi:hypothetical protein